MKPKLYYMDESPPVRSVFLTAKALNLELELISVNLLAGEHKTAQFKKVCIFVIIISIIVVVHNLMPKLSSFT